MKKLIIFFISLYQRYVSSAIPPVCRFEPTCSRYFKESVEKYGIMKGGLKSLWRIFRCNPFFPGGYDPP